MAEGTFAVGPAVGVHLQEAEIHSQLDFFHPVLSLELPYQHPAGLVFPAVQKVRDVEVHALRIWTAITGKSTVRRAAEGVSRQYHQWGKTGEAQASGTAALLSGHAQEPCRRLAFRW